MSKLFAINTTIEYRYFVKVYYKRPGHIKLESFYNTFNSRFEAGKYILSWEISDYKITSIITGIIETERRYD